MLSRDGQVDGSAVGAHPVEGLLVSFAVALVVAQE